MTKGRHMATPLTTDARPVLEASDIMKRYRSRIALDRVSLTAAAGEAVAVVGENGSGKTTLMRICAGVLRPDGGSVRAAGRIGYCPQEPALLDLLSADEHLVLFGAALGLPARDALAHGRDVLAGLRFRVADRTRAGELSGGSRQKLNLALAFSLVEAPIFASIASRAVDQRLVLMGYRPTELLLARLLVLEAYGAAVALGFSAVMIARSDPPDTGLLVAGVMMVAVVAVPFGLVLGGLSPGELEAVLVMIGVVGIQLTLDPAARLGELLPFWGPRRLLEGSLGDSISTPHAVETALAYAAALLALTFATAVRRLRIADRVSGPDGRRRASPR